MQVMLAHRRFDIGFLLAIFVIGLGLVGVQNAAWAENYRIEIVASGGSPEGTNWSFSSGTITATADVLINTTDIVSKLANGDLSISANQIHVSSDIVSSSNQGLTLKSVAAISTQQNITIQTNGGNIIFWTNSTAADNIAGHIHLDDGTTLNTINGSTASGLSGGGNIVLAGGADTNNDGYPDGFAKTTSTYGIQIDTDVKLHSGGGDIILRGETYSTATDRHGIFQTGNLRIDAGVGSIVMDGKNRSGYGSWALLLGNGTVSNLSLISAKPSGDAITLKSSGGRYGTYLGGTAGATMRIEATGGGNIMVTAQLEVITTNNYAFQTAGGDIVMWPNNTEAKRGRLQIGSNNTFNSIGGQTNQAMGGGDIIFAGGADGGNNRPSGYAQDDTNQYGIDIQSGLKIYSGGGNVTLKGRTNRNNDGFTRGIRQQGDLTIYSGQGAIDFDGQTLPTGASGYSIEFAHSTTNQVSVVSDKASGDAITINGNNTTNTYGIYFGPTSSGLFEATSGGNIVVMTARGIYTHSGYTFQTTGGDIVFWADNNTSNNGRILIGSNNTFNSIGGQTNQATGGGDIIFAGGADNGNNRPAGYARDDASLYGIDLRAGLKVYSGGGDITFKGHTYRNGTASTRGIFQWGDLTIYSGQGAIEFDGQTHPFRTSGYSIEFAHSTTNQVSVVSDKASGDAITINGNDTTNTYSIYFGPTSSGLFEATSGGNIVVKTARGIYTHSGYTFQTNGGDIVFWADTDGDGDGRIYVQGAIVFNSAGGNTNQATGGGTIVLAGGSDDGSNNGTANDGIPDGFAYDMTWRGVLLGNGVQMHSGGGDVLIRGRTNTTSNTYGIQQYNDLLINSGQGKITLHGKTRTDRDGEGVLLADGGITNGFSLISDKPTGTAIEIIGEGHSYGVTSNSAGSSKVIEATGGGEVIIDGKTPSAGYGVYLRDFDILSASGAITIEGYSTGVWLYDLTFGRLPNSLVLTSAADVTLRADQFRSNGSSAIATTGEVTIESHGASFDTAFTYPITNVSVSTDATALRVGKPSNNENVVIAASSTIDGPITIFGRDITLSANTQVKSTGSKSNTTVVATRDFVNNAGSSALLSDSGRWIVYLEDRQGNIYGDLNSNNIPLQASTYATLPPNDVAPGDRYVFAEAFSTDFTISARDVTKSYGDRACFAKPCADEPNTRFLQGYDLSSDIDPEPNVYLGGSAATGLPLSAIYATPPTITSTRSGPGSSVGTAPINITGGIAKVGYTVTSGVLTSTLTVVPRQLLIGSPEKPYDGTLDAIIEPELLRNVVNDDDLSVGFSTATYASKDAGENIDVTITGLTLGGAASANYVLTENQTVSGEIEPRVVQLRATKAYDGTTDLNGHVDIITGTTETLAYVSATAASAEIAGPDSDPATDDNYIIAITLLDATDGSGGLISNYALPALDPVHAPVFILDGALAKIIAWADDQSDLSKKPTTADYQSAGITGVDADSLALVNQAVADGKRDDVDSVLKLQSLVDSVVAAQAAAITKIESYALDPSDPASAPTVADYLAAGVADVTSDNVALINQHVADSVAADVDSLTDIQTLVDSVLSAQAVALQKIQDHASDPVNKPAPTIADYTDAGITSIRSENLNLVNQAVAGASVTDIDTLSKIEGLINSVVTDQKAALEIIEAYADNPQNGTPPTLADYDKAGISGVDAANLSAINAAVAQSISESISNTSNLQSLVNETNDRISTQNDALTKISDYADDPSDPTTAPTTTDYTDAGIDGVGGSNLQLINLALARASGSDVDTTIKAQAFVNDILSAQQAALSLMADYAANGNNTEPTLADYQAAGIVGVDKLNLANINALIASGTAPSVDDLANIQNLVDGMLEDQVEALTKIQAYADDSTTNPAPSVADYAAAATSGVTANNLGAINAAVSATTSTAVDTPLKLQQLVNEARRSAAAATIAAWAANSSDPAEAPTISDYVDAGVTGVDPINLDLVNDLVAGSDTQDIDQQSEVQALVNNVLGAQTAALTKIANYADAPSIQPRPSIGDYAAAGIVGVTPSIWANINRAVQAAGRTGADTIDEVQSLVNGIVNSQAVAIQLITSYTSDSTANPAPTVADYEAIGIAGVNAANLADLNAALKDEAAASVNTATKIQMFVNETNAAIAAMTSALAKIASYADNSTDASLAPTLSDYINAGSRGVDQSTLVRVNTAIAQASSTQVDTTSKLQAVIDAALGELSAALAKIEAYAIDSTTNPKPSIDDYLATGIDGVDAFNLPTINETVAGRNGTDVNTATKVQAVVGQVINQQKKALERIADYASDPASNPAPNLDDYLSAGVTGATADRLANFNAALRNATRSQVDTASKVQILINTVNANIKSTALAKISAWTDNATNSSNSPTVADYSDAGVTGIDESNLSLINAEIRKLKKSDVDSTTEIQIIANAVVNAQGNALAKIAAYATNQNSASTPTIADYDAAGITDVTLANLALVNASITTISNANIASTPSLIQAQVDDVVARMAAAISTITYWAQDSSDANKIPTPSHFDDAGVIGVDATNIGLINDALTQASTSSVDTTQEIQAFVDAIVISQTQALNKIKAYALNPESNPAPSVADYAAAGIEGVEQSNLGIINIAVTQLSSADLVNLFGSVQSATDLALSKQADAIHKIATYADDPDNSAEPTLFDYEMAGVSGVKESNLASLNSLVSQSDPASVDTLSKIQNLINGLLIGESGALSKIQAFATDPANNPEPTLADYVIANISGVNEDNLALVNRTIQQIDDINLNADIQKLIQTTVDGVLSDQADALAKIEAYVADPINSPAPNVSDYAAAGYTGVNENNLTVVNEAVAQGASFDDDRALVLNNVTVNEASPFVVLAIRGAPNQLLRLELASDTALSGQNFGANVQYLRDSTWVDYAANGLISLSDNGGEVGEVLIRTAILSTASFNGSLRFMVSAINTADQSFTSEITIRDDGLGLMFLQNNQTGLPDNPSAIDYIGPPLSDKRPTRISTVRVNESSEWVVLSVSTEVATIIQQIQIIEGETKGSAALGASPVVQLLRNNQWVDYDGQDESLAADSALFFRINISAEDDLIFEGDEVFVVQVTTTQGILSTEVTIADDGSGQIWIGDSIAPATSTDLTQAGLLPADDRPLVVTSFVVNAASPYAVYTVMGGPNQKVRLIALAKTVSLGSRQSSNDASTSSSGSSPQMRKQNSDEFSVGLEIFLDGQWQLYAAEDFVSLGPDGRLFVRLKIANNTAVDHQVPLLLIAVNMSGITEEQTGLIKNDGTGDYWLDDQLTPATAEDLLANGIVLTDTTPAEAIPVPIGHWLGWWILITLIFGFVFYATPRLHA